MKRLLVPRDSLLPDQKKRAEDLSHFALKGEELVSSISQVIRSTVLPCRGVWVFPAAAGIVYLEICRQW